MSWRQAFEVEDERVTLILTVTYHIDSPMSTTDVLVGVSDQLVQYFRSTRPPVTISMIAPKEIYNDMVLYPVCLYGPRELIEEFAYDEYHMEPGSMVEKT